jgi:hypothetical protein
MSDECKAYFFVFRSGEPRPSGNWCQPYGTAAADHRAGLFTFCFYESAKAPELAALAGKTKLIANGFPDAKIILIEQSTPEGGFKTILKENEDG